MSTSPSPFHPPGGERSSPDLRQEIQQIYRLVVVGLAALVILAVGVNLVLLKQFLTARRQLAATRTLVENLSAQYRQKEPAMREFVGALQTFAATHPDFQPTLHRYRRALSHLFVEPSGSISNRPPNPSNRPVAPPR
jgi:hypothetical protein